MKTYAKLTPPTLMGDSPAAIAAYVRALPGHLAEIQRALDEAQKRADPQALLQYLHVNPATPTAGNSVGRVEEGQIILADGTDYNPGEGSGMYLRDEANAAWGFLGPVKYGTWTPTITFATPGDLAVTYTLNSGVYTKVGRMVFVTFQLVTSAFTHTTAAGLLSMPGLPFACDSNGGYAGALDFGGITKATYTNFSTKSIASSSSLQFAASGSGVAAASVLAADTPTGGTLRLVGSLAYLTA